MFSLLVECSIRFLRALQQNRLQARLLYLFYNKELFNFIIYAAKIFPENFIFQILLVASAVHHGCTLIKHAVLTIQSVRYIETLL